MTMSDNELKFNLAEYLVGMENRLSAEITGVKADITGVKAEIKDVKADNNKRHDDHARETRDKIKELKVSIKWWIGIGLAVVTILLGILEYNNSKNSSKNSDETTVNHVIKLR